LQETDPKLRAEKEQAVFNEKKKRLKDLQDEKLQLECNPQYYYKQRRNLII